MTRRFELTRFAKSNLVDIVVWTVENFGPAQADSYETMIIHRCAGLVDGTTQSQDCATLEGRQGESGLRFARAQRHFIIFRIDGDRIIILALLHVASDLVSRIGSLRRALGN